MQTTTVGVPVSDALNSALRVVTKNYKTLGWSVTDKYIDTLKAVLLEVDGNDRRIVEMCINYSDIVRLVDIDTTFNGIFAVVSRHFQYHSVNDNELKQLLDYSNRVVNCIQVANCIQLYVQGDDANELVNGIEVFTLQY